MLSREFGADLLGRNTGASKLQTTLLQREYAFVQTHMAAFFASSVHATVSIDGWSNRRMQSAYGVVMRSGGKGGTRVLNLLDLSDETHDAVTLSDKAEALQFNELVVWS